MSIAMTHIRTGRFQNLEMNKLCGSEIEWEDLLCLSLVSSELQRDSAYPAY